MLEAFEDTLERVAGGDRSSVVSDGQSHMRRRHLSGLSQSSVSAQRPKINRADRRPDGPQPRPAF